MPDGADPNVIGFKPLVYRLDSRLLVVHGCPDQSTECRLYYYEWIHDRFRLLMSVRARLEPPTVSDRENDFFFFAFSAAYTPSRRLTQSPRVNVRPGKGGLSSDESHAHRSTNRRQPPQRAPVHRTPHRSRKSHLPPQRLEARTSRRSSGCPRAGRHRRPQHRLSADHGRPKGGDPNHRHSRHPLAHRPGTHAAVSGSRECRRTERR